ncbi:hypothetical protein H0A71_21365 [Alcaligenaceae bacterium]|nr:hypothetical protein [Alcaligenaceae bacterium]
MDKFKRYLGVMLCVMLLGLFIPVPQTYDSEYTTGAEHPQRLTPIDNTIITKLWISNDADWMLWRFSTSYLNICDKEMLGLLDRKPRWPCSDFGLMVALGHYSFYWENIEALNRLEPSLNEKQRAASNLSRNAKNLTSDELWSTAEFHELNEVAGKAVVQYLDSIKTHLSVKIYLINFALLIFIALGLRYRQILGNLIWMPFSSLGRVFVKGAKKAKDIHDKI